MTTDSILELAMRRRFFGKKTLNAYLKLEPSNLPVVTAQIINHMIYLLCRCGGPARQKTAHRIK